MSLELQNVTISLGGRQLVKSVNIDLSPGEVVGLLGPNGAGKTTTFNLVIGLLRPDAGHVLLDGKDVTELSWTMESIRSCSKTDLVNGTRCRRPKTAS